MKKYLITAMAAVLLLGLDAGSMAGDGRIGHAGKVTLAKQMVGGAAEKAKANRDCAKDKLDDAKVNRDAIKDKIEAKKAGTEEAKEKICANKEAAKDKVNNSVETRRENYVDKRQDHQGDRIQHGINKGYLTPEETQSLKTQQQHIADMESSYKSDGKLSKDEMKDLHSALSVASANIWAEKHDTDGVQMPTYRFGKNVLAKDSFTSAMANQNMTGAEAKALTSDFRKMMALKNSLANDSLSDAQRAEKQSEYNSLLNKYFEVK